MNFNLCSFKNVLGVPSQGFHEARAGPFALWDTIGTIIGAYIIQIMFFPQTSYINVLFWAFVLAEILHAVFCVETAFIKMVKTVL